MVDEVVAASSKPETNAAHWEPCYFGQKWSEAMAYINACVGSYDPVYQSAFGEEGGGYVPRSASWIFGGNPGNSVYPKFNNPYVTGTDGNEEGYGVGASLPGTDWIANQGYANYNIGWRRKVSNGSFCRQVMAKTYPCKNATAYPQKCGDNDCSGSNCQCDHYPLIYWQKQFSALRGSLLTSVSIYENANKSLLQGDTIDQFCAAKVAQEIVDAPIVDETASPEEQLAFEKKLADEEAEQRAQDRADQLYRDAVGDQNGDDSLAPTLPRWMIIGLGSIAAYAIYKRTRG